MTDVCCKIPGSFCFDCEGYLGDIGDLTEPRSAENPTGVWKPGPAPEDKLIIGSESEDDEDMQLTSESDSDDETGLVLLWGVVAKQSATLLYRALRRIMPANGAGILCDVSNQYGHTCNHNQIYQSFCVDSVEKNLVLV